jgi:peptide/nickel transport system substrate-binding protein
MLASSAAFAGKKDDTLVLVTEFEPPTYDYYNQTLREGVILSRHIWDSLYFTDPITRERKPHLATSIRMVDPKTIDIQLREDVVFHNGEKFDADDVVFTINTIKDPNNKYANSNPVSWIDKAEKIGPYSVRLHLPTVFAPALEYLSTSIVIYPNEYYAKVGRDEYSRAPVGTGPYKATEVAPGKRLVMEKFDRYFGGARGPGNINKIVFRYVPERNTQMAELLGRNADLIWRLPKDAAENLKSRRGIRVEVGDTMRVGYLQFDSAGRGGQSPATNLKFRQAVSHAIDREGIVKNLLGGGQVIHLACYPTQFGCSSSDAPRYDYSPEKARKLLAESGLANEVTIPFYGYRDRPIAEAMLGQLAAVGIRANLQWMQYSPLRDKVRAGEIPFNFMTWGSSSINDVSNITSYFFTGSGDDTARDPEVKTLLEKGDSSIDEEVRKDAYEKALKLIAERAHWLPLWSYAYFYAMSEELDFTPTPDEILHLYRAKWKG